MNDEIKEILVLYKDNDIEYYNMCSNIGFDKLLDYITNLQEENQKLKNQLDFIGEQNKYINKLEEKINNLQKENESLKEKLDCKEKFSKIMPEGTEFIILSKTDYDRQQEDIELIAIELKSRIEKAVEYLEQPNRDNFDYSKAELIDILKGGDE